MHLKSLTLKGFKSFASATTFHLEPGVTCVVGPNGSGKSNVVDALAWVMGEQGAKSLRGGKMEDVIFAGTAGRAPLGRAEVSLTIDNTDGSLPIDYTEVTISRTMFRNGGSDYAINGEPARLLDVQELLSDSGIGREMHVIVGQGQLDSVLHATPEDRRGIIEEAAGILKHRKRKEKALRKLDALQANLMRLEDLTTELRRQLKPLGRQAEVARRAVVIQSEARDARLRILADDLVTMRTALAAEIADEAALRERRMVVEAELLAAQARESELEAVLREDAPKVARAQEAWFALSSLRERMVGLASLSSERVRRLQPEPEEATTKDPEQWDAEAQGVREEEFAAGREAEGLRGTLSEATSARARVEEELAAEQRRVAAAERAAADRREGLARLAGQVAAATSRRDARSAEVERLAVQVAEARERAEVARREFQGLESRIAGLGEGEQGLDRAYETAEAALVLADGRVAALRAEEQAAERDAGALTARIEALTMSLERRDGAAALGARDDLGVRGPLASLVQVEPGAQLAVAVALGQLADAIVVGGADDAVRAFAWLRESESGRASLVLLDDIAPASRPQSDLPAGARWLADTLLGGPAVERVTALIGGTALVDTLDQAAVVRRSHPSLTVVTVDGDLLAPGIARGGSSHAPSLLEIQVAIDEASEALSARRRDAERVTFELAGALEQQRVAAEAAEAALSRLHESDAAYAAVAEQLGQLGQAARSAVAEADRIETAAEAASQALEADRQTLADLEARLASAEAEPTEDVAESDDRQRLAVEAQSAREAEVEARLALRTAEERTAALRSRAEELEREAAALRAARAAAEERRVRRARELAVATAVASAAPVVVARLERSVATAADLRAAAEQARAACDSELAALRASIRELTGDLERLTDSVHRDEVARAEQRLRIEQIEGRALEEFGVVADDLVGEYGPDQMVPPTPTAPGDDEPAEPPQPYAFDRVEQERRLAAAEKGLALLGKVNPLALEEFAALEERHRFLTEQLEDLRRSRADLMAIVKEVDERVQVVFAEAFEDISREFEGVFGRLFPGGEGRLILTDPDNMLTTGVDVEARPPGKRIKRLSLLSGGERSLTAVAFLVSLFKSRPSPFYVLDEVEAALDDVNLGRLIDVVRELQSTSQLVIITHQKRTMEIADALYGVSMRGDGVTQVISQRIKGAAGGGEPDGLSA